MVGSHTPYANFKGLYSKGERRTRPLTVVMAMNNAAGSNVAVRHGLRGPFANFSTACSSSAMALGEAMRSIMAGRPVAHLAGRPRGLPTAGAPAPLQPLAKRVPAPG